MERIQFYPKGEDPKGKNYIFFASHPADKEHYLDDLCSEILLAEENCVFGLDTQPGCPWDDMVETDLARMQMFLFPVTKVLLSEENPAISQWLPFALEHNIPVLPILVEPGLDGQYAQVFGDRQYIDKVTVDPTAIPYKLKLKRLLQDTLVSKEMAEKIRQAFDAYIFLSYRKKDRALAAKLMKLIHEIPQMRDVAIWYDEFLIPGENFNDNIAEALAKSDLFAMAVTPNLIGEDNYVLSTEYPEAIKAEKPVIAAQVAHTDLAAFAQTFPNEQDSLVDAYHKDMLKEALFGALGHIALAQNDDPMHNYLIGLAYLNGIDVEVDRENALHLITDSAQKDCLDAMEKLAQIYCGGNGVKPDFPSSMYWQERAVNCLRNHCRQSQSSEEQLHLADLLTDLALSHMNLFQWDAAKSLLTEARQIYGHYRQQEQLGEYATQRYYQTLGTLGTIAFAEEDEACVREMAFLIISELSDQYGECQDITYLPILAEAHTRAAWFLEKEGSISEAEDHYLQAIDLLEPYPEYEDSIAGKSVLVDIYRNFGEFYMRRNKYSSAMDCLARAEKFLKQILDQRVTPDYMGDIVGLYQSLGEACVHLEEYDEGERILNYALMCAERFEQASTMLFFKRSRALIYYWLAQLHGARGNKKDEESCYATSACLLHQLWESAQSKSACQEAAKAYQVLGACYQRHNKSAKATQSFHQAKTLLNNQK